MGGIPDLEIAVLRIFPRSANFEVFKGVVSPITVEVIHAKSGRDRTYKCRCNEPVDITLLTVEIDEQIAG